MAIHKKIKPINLELQKLSILKHYPEWKCKIKGSRLICKGTLKPSDLSNTYEIQISYLIGKLPKIDILSPNLEKGEKEDRPPHLYKDGSLCLFHPKLNEWDKSKKISLTIIPWTSLWLYYYEVWLATGKWKGGGIHPS